ncbi:sensor domain-containing diguanylate cyclase [Ferrimonas balearica]|uniref:GGDEF domain-containing protein n=1 Tax=Ferrimonas balearica TaxID=44012 RepID=UPI001C997618|nr:GGDEF domain-containing protein [Ferrimonas balearica]MBY5921441.1 GGDEF domain-containing protein [Ferrimonas balearica]MBY5995874.1 GGDEF domain-containing protein [Ferrimonas balearica]
MTQVPFWRQPEQQTLLAASSGEHTMARLRVWLILLITLVPSYKLLTGTDLTPALVVSYIALAIALMWSAFLRQRRYVPAMAFFSVTLDVSLITAGLWLDFICRDTPLALVNNKGTFALYFIAITATALRYDRRLSLYGGILALITYSGMILLASHQLGHQPSDPQWVVRYGEFFMPDQISRLLLLLMATLLAWTLVNRATALERSSLKDPLTGLYNRAFLRQHLMLTGERAIRNSQPLTVVMLDLDHFKRVNDRYGHAVGDRLLTAFAQRLKAGLRAGDLLARYGGEEFCLVLSQTSLEEAREVLAKLHKLVQNRPFEVGASCPISLTFSAGVSALKGEGDTPQALMERADNWLLEAKRHGRDHSRFDPQTA